MSQGSTEQEPSQGHPAWQVILDKLPDSLHPLILPELEAMDKRQQAKLQEVYGTYDPYKKFADNKVPAEVIEQALYLANHLQSDPEAFVTRAIQNFNIEKFQQAQATTEPQELEVEWDGEDISKHPALKALTDRIEALQGTVNESQREKQERLQQEQLDQYLDTLEEQNGEYDRLYVSALMANGVEGPNAVKQYQEMVNAAALKLTGGTPPVPPAQQQQVQAPVVMGASGTAGSGSPNEPISMGGMKNGEVQDLVIQMLEQSARDNQD
jgi:hypothetical protein